MSALADRTEQIRAAFVRLRVGDEFRPVGLLPFIPDTQRGHVMTRDLNAYVEHVSYGRYRKIVEMPPTIGTAPATRRGKTP